MLVDKKMQWTASTVSPKLCNSMEWLYQLEGSQQSTSKTLRFNQVHFPSFESNPPPGCHVDLN